MTHNEHINHREYAHSTASRAVCTLLRRGGPATCTSISFVNCVFSSMKYIDRTGVHNPDFLTRRESAKLVVPCWHLGVSD